MNVRADRKASAEKLNFNGGVGVANPARSSAQPPTNTNLFDHAQPPSECNSRPNALGLFLYFIALILVHEFSHHVLDVE